MREFIDSQGTLTAELSMRLFVHRVCLGCTLLEVARCLRVFPASIAGWEQGRKKRIHEHFISRVNRYLNGLYDIELLHLRQHRLEKTQENADDAVRKYQKLVEIKEQLVARAIEKTLIPGQHGIRLRGKISTLLVRQRERLGLTLVEMGRLLGVSRTTLCNWEHGYCRNIRGINAVNLLMLLYVPQSIEEMQRIACIVKNCRA